MGDARAVEIPLVIDEYLRFINETPKCARVNDSIAIALKFATPLRRRLRMPTASTRRVAGRPWRKLTRNQYRHDRCACSVASSASAG